MAVFVVWLASACQLEVSYHDSHFACADGRCPDGFTCVALQCEPARDACNKVSLLADAFDGDDRELQWGNSFKDSASRIEQSDGRLRITPPSSFGGASFAGYGSSRYYDLTDSSVAIDLPHMVNPESGAEAYFLVYNDDGDREAAFSQIGGVLRFYARVNGDGAIVSTPYDPVQHRHWRLRERAGTLYWETSRDGAAWTIRHQQPAPFDLSLVRVELSAGVSEAQDDPGFLEVEALNGGVARGSHCKVATLRDDFDDGVSDARWLRSFSESGCRIGEDDGSFYGRGSDGSGSAYCGYQSSSAFDLTGSELTAEITEMLAPGAPALVFFKLADDRNQHGLELSQEGGQLNCHFWVDGVRSSAGQTPWDEQEQRFWRLAERDGEVRWQTSPDGADWTTQCTKPTRELDVDDVEIAFGVGVFGPTWSAGSFRIDRLNLVP